MKVNEMKVIENRPVSSNTNAWAKSAVATTIAIGTAAAQAAAIDVTAVVTDIAAQAAPIGLVGAAVLLIYLAVKAFKWVRGALA